MFSRRVIVVALASSMSLLCGDVVIDALNAWWKQMNYVSKSDSPADTRYLERSRALVKAFSIKGKTVVVHTTLTKASRVLLDHAPNVTDAQGLCQEMGGFVWAKENRHFGLENIEIIGVQGDIVSARTGLGGLCTR